MVQLQILCGSRRGAGFCGARFPIRVGRAPDSDLCVEEPGVWPRHFHILWEPEGLLVEAEADALLEINGVAAQRALLRNGDVITVGALKIRFSFSAVRQSSLRLREGLTWICLAGLCAGQAALVWLLPH